MALIENSDIKYLFSEFFNLFLNVYKKTFNRKIISEIYKLSFYNIDYLIEKQNSSIFFEIDEPIQNEKEDRLGRVNFVQNIKDVFEENVKENKGNIFLLSADWGEGKTSCINLLKEQLNQNNIYKIIDLNPWFNDTKEKLLNAFFGEINHFTKTNFPYESLEKYFGEILNFSKINLGYIEFTLDKFTQDKNIQNKIVEIGNVLKEYSKRLIFIVDDVDRLEKNHILYILQVIQMFRQYTNIIFVLSCNYEKVEQILCEISEPCIQKKDSNEMIKKAAYYKDFLAKIITVPFFVPKAESYFIKKELLRKLNEIIMDESLINKETLNYISTEIFQTIRDIKRFYNHFVIAYKNVDKRLDIFNFINLSILYVFYPELYNNAYINRSQWFDTNFWNESVPRKRLSGNDLNSHEEEVKKSINNYFKSLLNKYNSKDQKCLKELFYLVSPAYYYANKSINYKKEFFFTETSYFRDKSFLSAYFLQYNFSVILNKKIKEWYKKTSKIRKNLIKEFILQEISKKQIPDIFDYIGDSLLYGNKYKKVYEDICLVFSENSLNIVDKQDTKVLDYITVSNIIISILNINRHYDFTKIIKQSSSVILALFLMHRCYSNIKNNFNLLFSNICSKIEKDIEIFLKSLYIQQNTMLFNICILAWLFGKQHFETYKQKENALNINKLNKEEFIELKRKVHLVISYFTKNIDWFKFFVLDSFLNNVETHFEFENNKIKNDNIKGAVVFPIQIWGLKNLIAGIEQTKDSNSITLFNNLIKDKSFIEELALEKILKERKDFTEDFLGYDYFKDKSGFQENKIFEAKIIKHTEGSTIELLRTEYIEDTNKIVNRDFLPQQNYLFKILWQEKHENIEDKNGIFIIHLICEEKDKQELEKNKKNLEDRLNSNKNIENKNFKFKIEIETRENLLSLYND